MNVWIVMFYGDHMHGVYEVHSTEEMAVKSADSRGSQEPATSSLRFEVHEWEVREK